MANPFLELSKEKQNFPQSDNEAKATQTRSNPFLEIGPPTGYERPTTPAEQKTLSKTREIKLAKEYQGEFDTFQAFLGGVIPYSPEGYERMEVLKAAHPVAAGSGELVGLIGSSLLTGGVAPTIYQAKLAQTIPTTARLVGAKMAQTGSAFGLKETIDQIAEKTSGSDASMGKSLGEILKSTSVGLGLGMAGSIANPLLRIPSEAAYGFATAKLQGADNLEAGVQGAIFGMFGLLNRANLSEQYRKAAIGGLSQAVRERARALGRSDEEAINIGHKVANYLYSKNIKNTGRPLTNAELNEIASEISKGAKIETRVKEIPAETKTPTTQTQAPIKDTYTGSEIDVNVQASDLLKVKSETIPPSPSQPIQKGALPIDDVTSKDIIAEKIATQRPLTQTEQNAFPDLADIEQKINKLKTAAIQMSSSGQAVPESITKRLEELYESIGAAMGESSMVKGRSPSAENIIGKEKPRYIRVREDLALRAQLRAEARAARAGFEVGVKETRENIMNALRKKQEDIKEIRKLIIVYANEHLPVSQRGKMLNAVALAKTQRDLIKAYTRIDQMVMRIGKKESVSELRQAIKDIDLNRLRPEYREKIEPILDSIDPVTRTEPKLAGLLKMYEFIQSHPDNQIPQGKLDQLRIFDKKNVVEMSTEEIQDISDILHHLMKLHDLKNTMIIKNKYRDAAHVREEAVENIARQSKPVDITGLNTLEKEAEIGNAKRLFGIQSWNTELISEMLDGQENGVIKQVLYGGIDDGISKQLDYQQKAEDFFKNRTGNIDVSAWSKHFQTKAKNIDFATVKIASGKLIKMTRGERIALYLHSKNDNNMDHILEGGISFSGTPSMIVKISEADMSSIIRTVTDSEKIVADAIYEFFNSIQKEQLNKVSVDLNGFPIAREPNYFPIRTNYLDRFRDELKASKNYSHKTLEGLGIFKERVGSKNALIINDAFLEVFKSIQQTGAYIGLAKPLRTAKMLLNDNDFQIVMRKNGKQHYLESLNDYLRKIEDTSIETEHLDKLTNELINKLDIAILGLNPWVMAKQPVSYLMAGTELDPKYLQRAGVKLLSKDTFTEMEKWHPQLRDRLKGNVTRELGELAHVGAVRKFFTNIQPMSAYIMEGIRRFDYFAVGNIWRAVKLEISEKYPALQGDEYMRAVAERSWEVIRKTQPTFHIKDRSEIGRSRSTLWRLATKYSSQRNKNYMMLFRATEKYKRSPGGASDRGKLASTLLWISLGNAVAIYAIDEIRNWFYERKTSKTPNKFIKDIALKSFGNVYVLGDILTSLDSKIQRGSFSGYDVENTVYGFANQTIDAMSEAGRALNFAVSGEHYKSGKNKGEKKWKIAAGRAVVGLTEQIGALKGLPIHTVRRILESFVKRGSRIVETF